MFFNQQRCPKLTADSQPLRLILPKWVNNESSTSAIPTEHSELAARAQWGQFQTPDFQQSSSTHYQTPTGSNPEPSRPGAYHAPPPPTVGRASQWHARLWITDVSRGLADSGFSDRVALAAGRPEFRGARGRNAFRA
jgi:hypothetical protein